MSTVIEVKSAIKQMTREEFADVREFIEQVAEDQLEMTDEFKAAIEEGRRDIAEGRFRIRQVEIKP